MEVLSFVYKILVFALDKTKKKWVQIPLLLISLTMFIAWGSKHEYLPKISIGIPYVVSKDSVRHEKNIPKPTNFHQLSSSEKEESCTDNTFLSELEKMQIEKDSILMESKKMSNPVNYMIFNNNLKYIRDYANPSYLGDCDNRRKLIRKILNENKKLT